MTTWTWGLNCGSPMRLQLRVAGLHMAYESTQGGKRGTRPLIFLHWGLPIGKFPSVCNLYSLSYGQDTQWRFGA